MAFSDTSSSRPTTAATTNVDSFVEEKDPLEPTWGAYVPPLTPRSPQVLLPRLEVGSAIHPVTHPGWNFLEHPESPRTLVFNFDELERNASPKRVLSPVMPSPTKKLWPPTRKGNIQFKEGLLYYFRTAEANADRWGRAYVAVDASLPIVFLYKSKLKEVMLGSIDLRTSIIQPTGKMRKSPEDETILHTFVIKEPLLREANVHTVRHFGTDSRDKCLHWLQFLYRAKQNNSFVPAKKNIHDLMVPPNTLLVTEREVDVLTQTKLPPQPQKRFLDLSDEDSIRPLKSLIHDAGYTLRESYRNGPVLPFKPNEYQALRIQTWYRTIAAKHFVFGYHGLKNMTWGARLVQRALLGARVRWHMKKVKRCATTIQRLWKAHKIARAAAKQLAEHRRKITRAKAYFNNATSMRILRYWRSYVVQRLRSKRLARRVFQGVLSYAFFSWVDFTGERQQMRTEKLKLLAKSNNRKAKFFLKRMIMAGAARSLCSWRDYVVQKKKMRALFGRVMQGELKVHFLAWHVLKCQLKDCRRLRKKIFRHVYERYIVKWEVHVIRAQAAKAIQGIYRVHWSKFFASSKARWFNYAVDCAEKIQRRVRVFLAHKKIFGYHGMLNQEKRSLILQTWWRSTWGPDLIHYRAWRFREFLYGQARLSEYGYWVTDDTVRKKMYGPVRTLSFGNWKYRIFQYKLALTQIRSRFWYRRRVSAAINIQWVWRWYVKYCQERNTAAEVIQRTYRTYCALRMFWKIKTLLYETYFEEPAVYAGAVKARGGFYCLYNGRYSNQMMHIQLTVASSGQSFNISIPCLDIIDMIENDENLRFQATPLKAVFVKIVKTWILIHYEPHPNVFRTVNADEVKDTIKTAFFKHTGYPMAMLKDDVDIEWRFSISKEEQIELLAGVFRAYDVEVSMEDILLCKSIGDLTAVVTHAIESILMPDTRPNGQRDLTGISLRRASLPDGIKQSIQHMIDKRTRLQQSLEKIESEAKTTNEVFEAASAKFTALQLQLQAMEVTNQKLLVQLGAYTEKEHKNASDLEDAREHLAGPLRAKLNFLERKISTLEEELDGGFFYDQLPSLEKALYEYENNLATAKADVEMEEYDSDDIDEFSREIKKTKKQIERVLKELEKIEEWRELQKTKALLPAVREALEEVDTLISEYEQRGHLLQEHVQVWTKQLHDSNVAKGKLWKENTVLLKQKLHAEEDAIKLRTRFSRTRGSIQSLFTLVGVKQKEYEKACVVNKVPSKLHVLFATCGMFLNSVFPTCQKLEDLLHQETSNWLWAVNLDNSASVDEKTKMHIKLLRDIETYKAKLQKSGRIKLGKQIVTDLQDLDIPMRYFGALSSVKAQAGLLFLFNQSPKDAFDATAAAVLNDVRQTSGSAVYASFDKAFTSIEQTPLQQRAMRGQDFVACIEKNLAAAAYVNNESGAQDDGLRLFSDATRKKFNRMVRAIDAAINTIDTMEAEYTRVLEQKKKKNLSGATDMRIRAGLLTFIACSSTNRKALLTMLNTPEAKTTMTLMNKMNHARHALSSKSSTYVHTSMRKSKDVQNAISLLLGAVGINNFKEIDRLKTFIHTEVVDLVFHQLPSLRESSKHYANVCKSHHRVITCVETSMKEYFNQYEMLLEDIAEERRIFLEDQAYLEERLCLMEDKKKHIEKIAARKEAKLYGGNLEYVQRLRRHRHAAIQIQLAWGSMLRRIAIKAVPETWDKLEMEVAVLVQTIASFVQYLDDESERIVPSTKEDETDTMVKDFKRENNILRRVSKKVEQLQGHGKRHELPQCQFAIQKIRQDTSDLVNMLQKIGYVNYRTGKITKQEVLAFFKATKMVKNHVMSMIYAYRPEERLAFDEESDLGKKGLAKIQDTSKVSRTQKIGKALKYIVVNPITKAMSRHVRRQSKLAAKKIAWHSRVFLWRRYPGWVQAPHDMREAAVIKMQALVRGHIQRIRTLEETGFDIFSDSESEESDDPEYLLLKEKASTVIQQAWRCNRARLHMRMLVADNYKKVENADKPGTHLYLNLVTQKVQTTKPISLGPFDLSSPRTRARGLLFRKDYYTMVRWKKTKKKRLSTVLMHSIIRHCDAEYCENVETHSKEYRGCSNNCGIVWYCSKGCERADWGRHRKPCAKAVWRKTSDEGQKQAAKEEKTPIDFLNMDQVNGRIEVVINKAMLHLQATGFMPDRETVSEMYEA